MKSPLFTPIKKFGVAPNQLECKSSTSLKAVGVIAGAISGGIFAGGLHAIAGKSRKRGKIHIIHVARSDRLYSTNSTCIFVGAIVVTNFHME